MDKRIATALAAGTFVALPLLTACGTSTAPQGGSAAPAASSAAAAPSTTAAAVSPTPSPSPSPSSDPTQETAAVKAATEKFFTTALTIGYPDTRYSVYTKRLKPLMTSKAFDSLSRSTTSDKGDKTLQKLSDRRTRTTPRIKTQKVTSVTTDSADVKITYQNLAQQKSGDGWKTLKTSSTETDDVKLVKEGDAWLVDDLG